MEALEELSALQAVLGPQDARIVSRVTLNITYQATLFYGNAAVARNDHSFSTFDQRNATNGRRMRRCSSLSTQRQAEH